MLAHYYWTDLICFHLADISAARLANIEGDLGLSPVEYQTCVSILFVGYILAQ